VMGWTGAGMAGALSRVARWETAFSPASPK